MRAFVVDRYGTDRVVPTVIADPTIGGADVLVRVHAASINPLDTMTRAGEFKRLIKRRPPFVLGHDLAGVVTEVGAEVRDIAVGDEVYSRPRDSNIGTFAEYLAVDREDVALKPRSLTFEEASAVPLVSLAAWQILVERAQVQPGQKVLVHAGAGGLGSTLIQLAKHLGATVATTCNAGTADLVRTLGSDIVIDHRAENFAEVISDYDLVIDSVGGDNLQRSLTVLRKGGLAIGVAGPPDAAFAHQVGAPRPLALVMHLLSRRVRRRAERLGVTYEFFFMRASGAQLRELAALYDSGALRPVLDRTFAFDQTPEAMAYVEQRRPTAGKVVVSMGLPGTG
ncbi:NADP-dependent oxidoreductase [Nocardioides cavernae]|uniref:NADP-dependent oxidoreductase n=1 Tax=Nocardioides cavernae TaxID=1921566 RepID=A0ABR8N8L8_9ACTN|nr:NADP-dependent oxidoreductase [Nocardioides cavernae]MBD3924483.1 NADP-dependent oxidoreductase [Nocardioides cavernae]MBM7510571.1 NADPH:quinone reductase-like Zn-dependent oxidoreductase [Nocardioides cavernae]